MSRRYEKELPVKLTEPEIAQRAKFMARTALDAAKQEIEIETAKERAKNQLKAMKDQLVSLRERLRELAREVRRGEAVQPVEVEARIAPDNSKVEIIRLDTGEVVSEIALTEQDRQMELDEVLARIQADSERTAPKPDDADDDDDDFADIVTCDDEDDGDESDDEDIEDGGDEDGVEDRPSA